MEEKPQNTETEEELSEDPITMGNIFEILDSMPDEEKFCLGVMHGEIKAMQNILKIYRQDAEREKISLRQRTFVCFGVCICVFWLGYWIGQQDRQVKNLKQNIEKIQKSIKA